MNNAFLKLFLFFALILVLFFQKNYIEAAIEWERCDNSSKSCADFCQSKGKICANRCTRIYDPSDKTYLYDKTSSYPKIWNNVGLFQAESGYYNGRWYPVGGGAGYCSDTKSPLFSQSNLSKYCNLSFNVYCCCADTNDIGIIGLNRFRLLDGNQYNSPATLIVNNNLQTQKSNTLYTSFIARNWPSGIAGKTQWSHFILANPNGTAANVTIKVYSAHNGAGKTNGQLLATIQRNIPPYGWFNSYNDNDLNNLPDNYDADGIQTLAWAEINACAKKNLGDANCDEKIDGIDYSMWLNRQCNSGCAAENLKADFNLDNKVNDDDYSIWFNNRQ